MKKIFESENLYFVNVSEEYINDYLTMINNTTIQDFIATERRIYDYDGEIEWIKSKLKNNDPIYTIIEKKSDMFVGTVEFKDVKDAKSELGICITPKFQDQHYGTETLKRVIEYGLNNLGLKDIYLKVFSSNPRAIHCYKKVGFIEYDIEKNVKELDGKKVDEISMKLKK